MDNSNFILPTIHPFILVLFLIPSKESMSNIFYLFRLQVTFCGN
nr:MAG TPA: hypothetical protein [Caudoviricetes sp.]